MCWCLYSVSQERSRKIWSGAWEGRQKTLLELRGGLVMERWLRLSETSGGKYRYSKISTFDNIDIVKLTIFSFYLTKVHTFGGVFRPASGWICGHCSSKKDCRGKERKQTPMPKSKGRQRISRRRWKEGMNFPDLLKKCLAMQQGFRMRQPELLKAFTLGSCYY